ncbi:MAG: DUF58 domain-containing protein [Oscillospiraceae bacterium]|nr:DUF58 domain-containing protein [Oscillospiraceae bacterium]
MTGRRFLYLTALVCCLVFYIAYQGWVSWILLLTMLGIPWLSLLLSIPVLHHFRVEADGPSFVQMGQSAQAELWGLSHLPQPLFRGQIYLRRCITGEVWRYREREAIPTDHCGGIVVTAQKVRVCDYLGLFRFKVKRLREKTILVRPNPVPVADPPDLSRYLARSWRPKPGGGYAENHELRLYRPGDGLNQVHWKLTAKTGKLIIREPMEPSRGLMLLTMDLCGTPDEIDRKFGQLLWMSRYLLAQNLHHELHALTGSGLEAFTIGTEADLTAAVDRLLTCPQVTAGSVLDRETPAAWQYRIGGAPDEA